MAKPLHIKNSMQSTEKPFNNSVVQKGFQRPNANKNKLHMLCL